MIMKKLHTNSLLNFFKLILVFNEVELKYLQLSVNNRCYIDVSLYDNNNNNSKSQKKSFSEANNNKKI